jgi:hypothetical protein
VRAAVCLSGAFFGCLGVILPRVAMLYLTGVSSQGQASAVTPFSHRFDCQTGYLIENHAIARPKLPSLKVSKLAMMAFLMV